MLYGKADNDYECDECGADIAPRMWDCRFCNWCLCLACGWSRSGRTFRKLPSEDREHVLGKAMEDVEHFLTSEAMFFDLLEEMCGLMSVIEAGAI